jgi:hypothetical protein
MILLVAKQVGLYVISTSVGLAIGAYAPKYVNKNVVSIIGHLMSGGI